MNQPTLVPGPPNQSQSSALAIWSLILGILSLAIDALAYPAAPDITRCFWGLVAIPAVICGHRAQSRIKASAGRLAGAGLAVAGLITGYLSVFLSLVVVPMLLLVVIPNLVKAKATALRSACLSNLMQIDGAKQQWSLEYKKELKDTPTQVDLDPYLRGGYSALACPAGGTYTIKTMGESPTCSIKDHQLP